MIIDHHGSLFCMMFSLFSLLKKHSTRDAVLKEAGASSLLVSLCIRENKTGSTVSR
jgi:hypothetical protein